MKNQNVEATFRLIQDQGVDFPLELLNAVEKITVEEEINLPTMFGITLSLINTEEGGWRGVDLETFQLGDVIKVSLGVDSNVQQMTVGEIVSLEPYFGPPNTPSYMQIRGYDLLHRLRFGTYQRSFEEKSDAEVASVLIKEGKLKKGEMDDPKIKYPLLYQENQSNYEFLLKRAKRIGFEIGVTGKEGDQFVFRKPKEGEKEVVTLDYGLDLESFYAQLNALPQGAEVEVRGWDVQKKEEISVKTKVDPPGEGKSGYKLTEEGFGSSLTTFSHFRVKDLEDAKLVAEAQRNLALEKFLVGTGVCLGNPNIQTGKNIKLEGLGEKFSGNYYVTSTTHTWDRASGYKTKFKVRRAKI